MSSSLSERLGSAIVSRPNNANRGGCVTCKWWRLIDEDDRKLVNEWLDAGYSGKQLHDILTDPDGDGPVLEISLTGFRLHLNHHDAKCRGGKQPR